MRKVTRKETRKLIAYAENLGYVVREAKNAHFIAEHPSGARTVFGSTPSDHRSVKNAEADLRRRIRGRLNDGKEGPA